MILVKHVSNRGEKMKEIKDLIVGEVLTWGKSVFELNELDDINECDCDDGNCVDNETERMGWCREGWWIIDKPNKIPTERKLTEFNSSHQFQTFTGMVFKGD